MEGIINISLLHLLSAYIFVIILTILFRKRQISGEKDLFVAVFRMTIQLALVGYILEYIFGSRSLWLTLLALTIMETFAVRNVYNRVKIGMSSAYRKVVAVAMPIGTLFVMLYFFIIILGLDPWYEPRYVIPLAGMIIGNSMTGIALGAERLADGVRTKRNLIEGALMLGASPEAATKEVVNTAFYAGVLPTINNMVSMGIVSLPGMMTGQILSGTSPLIATRYQIAIMLGILGAVTLTVFIMVTQGIKTFFNDRAQLVLPEK